MADPYLHSVTQRGDRFYVDDIDDLNTFVQRKAREMEGQPRKHLCYRAGAWLRTRFWDRGRRAR
ncbi:MAG: hypothetical protein ACLFU8_10965 [Anaerolineales bacterium]